MGQLVLLGKAGGEINHQMKERGQRQCQSRFLRPIELQSSFSRAVCWKPLVCWNLSEDGG